MKERLIMTARSIAPDFYRLIEERVERAANNTENRNDDGTVNWNFVDADVFMETNPTANCVDLFYQLFEEAADYYLTVYDNWKKLKYRLTFDELYPILSM